LLTTVVLPLEAEEIRARDDVSRLFKRRDEGVEKAADEAVLAARMMRRSFIIFRVRRKVERENAVGNSMSKIFWYLSCTVSQGDTDQNVAHSLHATRLTS
jgi:hypothetical protein